MSGSDNVSRYDGASRYDGGIAGSTQRVLISVHIIDADSTVFSDVSRYDDDGGMHGSDHRDLSNVVPFLEKIQTLMPMPRGLEAMTLLLLTFALTL